MKKWSFIIAVLMLALTHCQSSSRSVRLFNVDQRVTKEKSELQNQLDQQLTACVDLMLDLPAPPYRQEGRRLLAVSRTYLKRCAYLGYAYQLTGSRKYAEKCEELMRTSAGFSHWNPSHFLDAAEMTLALAVGLDWTRDALSAESIEMIENAIFEKGIKPSLEPGCWFIDVNHNWNQVCHSAMAVGAMAIYHRHPELADRIIQRSREKVKIPEALYEPDGAYPEGPTYWQYGTAFHVLFLDAYSHFHPDHSLKIGDGFLKSQEYMLHVIGPQGAFNYFDNGLNIGFSAPLVWMAGYTGRTDVLYHQQKWARTLADGEIPIFAEGQSNRLLPFALLWLKKNMFEKEITVSRLNWTAGGVHPVSFHRTGWGKRDVFLAVKGGSPELNHGHMDAGSFVLDAKGKRWVMDLGRHDYHRLESQGINFWDKSQTGDRWKVFRLTNQAHSTLTIDGALQRVAGKGIVLDSVHRKNLQLTELDLSELYAPYVNKVIRTVALTDGRKLGVMDVIENNDAASVIRWSFPTLSQIRLVNDSEAILSQDDEFIVVKIEHPSDAAFKIYSAQPQNDFEDKNPGVQILGFETMLDPEETGEIKVVFQL